MTDEQLSVFNIKHGKAENFVENPDPVDTFYTDRGETLTNDSREAYCKKTKFHDNKESYYVKTGPQGQILDPWSDNGGKLAADAMHGGMPVWRYNKVPPEVFQYYLRFLQTRNKAHYITAQRVLRNAT